MQSHGVRRTAPGLNLGVRHSSRMVRSRKVQAAKGLYKSPRPQDDGFVGDAASDHKLSADSVSEGNGESEDDEGKNESN